MARRNFIKGAASFSAVTILSPAAVFALGTKPAFRLGFIGCGRRGMADISSMSKNTNLNIVAITDLFQDQIQVAKPKLDQLNAAKGFFAISQSNIYQSSCAYRKLLNNKEVDAVLISSPCYAHPAYNDQRFHPARAG